MNACGAFYQQTYKWFLIGNDSDDDKCRTKWICIQIKDKTRNKLCGISHFVSVTLLWLLKTHGEQQEVLDNHSELKFVVCRLLFRVVRFSNTFMRIHLIFFLLFFSAACMCDDVTCVRVCVWMYFACFYSLFLSYLLELTSNHNNGITRETCYINRIHTFQHTFNVCMHLCMCVVCVGCWM